MLVKYLSDLPLSIFHLLSISHLVTITCALNDCCVSLQMTSTSKSRSSLEKYYLPLKEGEEAHWEVS